MSSTQFELLHGKRVKLIDLGNADFIFPKNFEMKSFEELVLQQIGCNKCFTLYDLHSGCFVKFHLVKEVFGYDNKEFTIQAVNNFGEIKLVHPDDIDHKKRYDNIVYKIIASEKDFGIRMDSYYLNLRMFHKNGDILSVKRSSYIFEANDHIPLTQFDVWEIANRYKATHVFPELIVSNKELKDKITEEFYRANLTELKLKLSNVALKVLHYKVKGESNKLIAEKVCIKPQSVANCHYRNFQKLQIEFTSDIDKIVIANSSNEDFNVYREICKRYGLYPVPDSILST